MNDPRDGQEDQLLHDLRELRTPIDPPAGLEDDIVRAMTRANVRTNLRPRARSRVSPWWRVAAVAAAFVVVFGVGREVGRREAAVPVVRLDPSTEPLMDNIVTLLELTEGEHIHTHTCLASHVDGRRFCILDKAQPLAATLGAD